MIWSLFFRTKPGKQWDAVTRLTDRVAEVLHSIGGLDRAKKGQL